MPPLITKVVPSNAKTPRENLSSQSRRALIRNKNSPAVRKTKGNEIILRKGFTSELRKPKTSPAMTKALIPPVREIEVKKYVKA